MTKFKVVNKLLIKSPEIGTEYHYDNGLSKLDCSFSGSYVNHIYAFDLATLMYWTAVDGKKRVNWFSIGEFFVVPEELIPVQIDQKRYPIIAVNVQQPQPILCSITRLNIAFDNQSPATFSASMDLIPNEEKIFIENNRLHHICEKTVSDIPIATGTFPILMKKEKPSRSFIENLYKQFIQFNNNTKLLEQYAYSQSHCHVRAHVINLLLSWHGIESVKLYKSWDVEQWENRTDRGGWLFHCAAAVLTDSDEILTWDPWVGMNNTLLELKDWVHHGNLPTPKALLVASRGTISFADMGKIPGAVHGITHFKGTHLNSLQAVMGKCIENGSVKSLLTKNEKLMRSHFFAVANMKKTTKAGGGQKRAPGSSFFLAKPEPDGIIEQSLSIPGCSY